VRVRLKFITPLLAAGVAVAAIAVAPTAAADPTPVQSPPVAAAPAANSEPARVAQSCTNLGGTQTQCQSPGNVQIYDAPPQVNYFPLGDS
jgi:hypothetical protein